MFVSSHLSQAFPSTTQGAASLQTDQADMTYGQDYADGAHDCEAELSRDVLAVLQGVRQAPVILKRVDHTQRHFLFVFSPNEEAAATRKHRKRAS